MHTDLELFAEAFTKAGILVSLQPSTASDVAVNCYYRCNPDGSIRWIWPAAGGNADFLKFYHAADFRSRLFSVTVRTLQAIKALRWAAHGSFIFYTNTQSAYTLQEQWKDRWAFFTGTIGPNRKAVLWNCCDFCSRAVFIKIPLTETAVSNLQYESLHLRKVQAHQSKGIMLPQPMLYDKGILELTDISKGTTRTNNFKRLPAKATQAWLQQGLRNENYSQSRFSHQIAARLRELSNIADPRIPSLLIQRLQQLHESLICNTTFITTHAHGDFTPWNVLVKDKQLHLIDFELASQHMPFLYDLFHFIYQSNILVRRAGYAGVRSQLSQLWQDKSWQRFLRQHDAHVNFYESCYLLHTVSYYLLVYSRQPHWHTQVNWLLQTWSNAVADRLQIHIAPRMMLLQDIKEMLSAKKHAVLKWMYEGLDSLPATADIDVCMKKEDAVMLCKELKSHPLVRLVRVRRRSFMMAVETALVDGTVLHIDLIHAFKRKGLEFMQAPEVLSAATMHSHGFFTAAQHHDLLYTWLFYWLNECNVPQRYRAHFLDLPTYAKTILIKQVRDDLNLPVASIEQLFQFDRAAKARVVAAIKKQKQNRGFAGAMNKFRYIIDSCKNCIPSKGLIVTFSGVDGAGKSTVIEQVKHEVEKVMRRRVIVLRHRPSLLPILSAIKHGRQAAETKAAQTLPRQGNNRNILSSLLRFCYYFADYFFGQFYVCFRYVSRGYVVLYDRYYFDFINDSRRSNINLPRFFTRAGYWFLAKPHLNFFLYADADVIYQRKQELQPADISQLTNNYLSLFQQLQNNRCSAEYIAVENNQLKSTLSIIFQHIYKKFL